MIRRWAPGSRDGHHVRSPKSKRRKKPGAFMMFGAPSAGCSDVGARRDSQNETCVTVLTRAGARLGPDSRLNLRRTAREGFQMTSMQEVIDRINARLAALDRERREDPDWLTRLMLVGSRPLETPDVRASNDDYVAARESP